MKIKVHNKSGMKFKKIEKKIDIQFLDQFQVFDGMADLFCYVLAILWGAFLLFLGIVSLFAQSNQIVSEDGTNLILLTIFLKLLIGFLFGGGGACIVYGRIKEILLRRNLRTVIKTGSLLEKLQALKIYEEKSLEGHFCGFGKIITLNHENLTPSNAYQMLLIAKTGKVTLKWNKKTGNVSFSFKDKKGNKHSFRYLDTVPYVKTKTKPRIDYFGDNIHIKMYERNK